MTGEVVNLRRARKNKARAEKDAVAAENRARFGRSRAERQLDAKVVEADAKRLDGHKREE